VPTTVVQPFPVLALGTTLDASTIQVAREAQALGDFDGLPDHRYRCAGLEHALYIPPRGIYAARICDTPGGYGSQQSDFKQATTRLRKGTP
jgi:hypothetical protein